MREGDAWSQQAYVKASNTGISDRFGYAVAALGDTVVVGAPVEDSPATGVDGDQTNTSSAGASGSGAAYVLDLDAVPTQEIAVVQLLGAGLKSGVSTVDFKMHCVGFDSDPKTLVIGAILHAEDGVRSL